MYLIAFQDMGTCHVYMVLANKNMETHVSCMFAWFSIRVKICNDVGMLRKLCAKIYPLTSISANFNDSELISPPASSAIALIFVSPSRTEIAMLVFSSCVFLT